MISIGKHKTIGDYKAEIIGQNILCPNFILQGFILAGKTRCFETAWNLEGKNIEKGKWDLK